MHSNLNPGLLERLQQRMMLWEWVMLWKEMMLQKGMCVWCWCVLVGSWRVVPERCVLFLA